MGATRSFLYVWGLCPDVTPERREDLLPPRKKENTTDTAARLAQPLLEELGLTLWDLRFEKEGSLWYLRYFIDKEGGVTIDDCEQFSRAVEKKLDAADPISQSYTLEVSSPGIFGCLNPR